MYFPNIPVIPYEGPNSTNPLAFKFYNPDQVIMGKMPLTSGTNL